ncbi:hypothetical protein Bca52824_068485 [Brassica carinata]|uniref:Uncharacterized protein n=1 Tax=Brassica carinata TaxID=52824 RepID=A0A8X7U212_BRACI|nr:hypothetical protein Bca52824_068485 [Brassica carinata]
MDIQRDDPVDKIPVFVSALNGAAVAVASYMALMGVDIRLSMLLLLLGMLGAALSSFLSSGLRGRTWIRCFVDGFLAGAAFFFGGILPTSIEIEQLLGVTFGVAGAIILLFLVMRLRKRIPLPHDSHGNLKPDIPWLAFFIAMVASVGMVLLAGKINNLRSANLQKTYSCGRYNTTRKL